jgi:hypothetical protein
MWEDDVPAGTGLLQRELRDLHTAGRNVYRALLYKLTARNW